MIARVRAARRRRAEAAAAAGAAADPAAAAAVAVDPDVAAADWPDVRLGDVALREMVELVHIDLPSDEIEPLLELGLLPGCRLCPVRRSPFGDPVVMVDGALIALRREMAGCICVRRPEPAPN